MALESDVWILQKFCAELYIIYLFAMNWERTQGEAQFRMQCHGKQHRENKYWANWQTLSAGTSGFSSVVSVDNDSSFMRSGR